MPAHRAVLICQVLYMDGMKRGEQLSAVRVSVRGVAAHLSKP